MRMRFKWNGSKLLMLVSPGMPVYVCVFVGMIRVYIYRVYMSLLTIVQLVEELLYALRGAIDETLFGYLTLFNVICCGSIRIWISSSIDLNFKIKTHINAEKQIRFSGAIFGNNLRKVG